MDKTNFKKEFDLWKKENAQHGRQAFPRFVMLKFLDSIQVISSNFIFKGGNLLWHYIKTPRETTDLDLITLTLNSHQDIKTILEKTRSFYENITFEIKEFKEINKKHEIGAALIIEFKTTTGQINQFNVDIVYAIPTDLAKVKSTTSNLIYEAASIENIISDKIAAAYQFRGGNTRMKDFDDLWRISNSPIKIDKVKLKKIMKSKNLPMRLEDSWIEFMEVHWKRHASYYKDIPKNLSVLFEDINNWLSLF